MILIIEDNPEVAAIFAEIVISDGYEAVIAPTGALALEQLLTRSYALGLVDLSLPDMNGADIARQAREAGVQTPLVAVSGAMPLIDPQRLADAQFVHMMTKPVKLTELLEIIAQFALPPGSRA